MGTHINLLDWRAARRERRLQDFKRQMVAAAAIGIALALLWYMQASGVREDQEARNDLLRSEIKALDQKIKEIANLEKVQDNLLARMEVIESLQASRSASVHLFDELVATLPEGVHLNRANQNGEQVQLEGVAESNARVSQYMKNLEASLWFENPRLIVIRSREQGRLRLSEFTLQVRALRKPPEADGEGGGNGN
ncbi:MAG: PilN domain-containing protein [Algiphilus sp.]